MSPDNIKSPPEPEPMLIYHQLCPDTHTPEGNITGYTQDRNNKNVSENINFKITTTTLSDHWVKEIVPV